MNLRSAFIAIILASITSMAHAGELVGKVVGVHDADTITILDASNTQHKIRLEGIDAPERGQAFGVKATDALKAALGGEPVRVVVSNKDRYGRVLGTVYSGDRNLNAWLIANGWAWHYKAYSNDARLAELEKAARAAKLGLWADSSPPIAPWDFRAAGRQRVAIEKSDAAPGGWWLNTSSSVRHNSTCRYFGKTSKGRACAKDEGKACGICGG